MKKPLIISFVVLGIISNLSAQEKPYRAGIKIGVPQIVGLNAEYATPLLGGRLAPSVDFSTFSISGGSTELSFNYIEIGSNLYLKETARGLYGNISYGRIGMQASYSDPDLGNGESKVGFNFLNLKVGAKLGNGFYFRPEVGYAVGFGKSTVSVEYVDPVDGSTTVEEENAPGIFGGLIFNIGFGFAFGG